MTIHERYPFTWRERKMQATKTPTLQDIKRKDIEVLDLDLKLFNALKRNGINTLGDILVANENDRLIRIKNLGAKSVEVINKKLYDYLGKVG